MNKKLIFAALALTALVSCTSDEFVGDLSQQNSSGTINFNPSSKALTRATSNTGTVAEMLDGQMKIYGVKKTNGSGSDPATYATVFDDYVLWSNTTNVTTSNPDATTATAAENGWEYVGTTSQTYGADNTSLTKEQYIKYWDWSTDEYHFVAGSPVANFTYTITSGDIASATVTGIAGHLNPNSTSTALSTNPVYIANPVKKQNDQYNTDVLFSFTRQQAFVRVGVFETIPGYNITEIKFYPYDESSEAWGSSPVDNIVLASTVASPAKYFQGAENGTATITYDWTTPSYTFDYSTGLTAQKNWYGGKYNYVAESGTPAWEMATSSAETNVDKLYGKDGDRGTNGYFTVIPMKSGGTAQPILVKCDYVLTALGGTGETIKVSGATAAIPAAFTYWNPNTSYTYLFKISDNTNGKTGSSQPNEGLYPITFDAVVVAETDGTEQGTITTVSTPSITTYQEGSVTTDGITYKYNSSDAKPIYFTAQNDETGALYTLSALNNTTPAAGMVQVYTVAAGTTEADLILTRPTTTFTTSIGAAAWSINGQSVASGNWASFTPTSAGTYAIEFVYSVTGSDITARSYKVVVVE